MSSFYKAGIRTDTYIIDLVKGCYISTAGVVATNYFQRFETDCGTIKKILTNSINVVYWMNGWIVGVNVLFSLIDAVSFVAVFRIRF